MEQMAQPQITGYCRAPPWMGNNLVTKTVTIVLPMLQFNQFLANQPAGQVWLDFYIQDDTEVDFAQLTLVQ